MITASRPKVSNDHAARLPVAVVLAVGLSVVAAFQTPRAFGEPLGAAALGGTDPGQLPNTLRPPTGWFAAVGLVAALLALVRGGYDLVLLPAAVPGVGMLVALLGAGPLMNVASSSPWERFGWGPFSLVMFIFCVVLARSGLPSRVAAGHRASNAA
jgi:hypothetical protein